MELVMEDNDRIVKELVSAAKRANPITKPTMEDFFDAPNRRGTVGTEPGCSAFGMANVVILPPSC